MNSSQTLVLGGGCFWCTESVFKAVRGVLDVESGYCNGLTPEVSYELVCTGRSGYAEVVKLVYDPEQISTRELVVKLVYDPEQVSTRELLEIFFVIHDPTTLNRQGHDVGTQYRSGIYFTQDEQREVAQALMDELSAQDAFGAPIVTELLPLEKYFAAEDYHQDFFERNPTQGYCMA
ncbi:MAG: peptide-methionine (S)-S-oxide reductase MsrA, partial [Pseudomonadota bacterium]